MQIIHANYVTSFYFQSVELSGRKGNKHVHPGKGMRKEMKERRKILNKNQSRTTKREAAYNEMDHVLVWKKRNEEKNRAYRNKKREKRLEAVRLR